MASTASCWRGAGEPAAPLPETRAPNDRHAAAYGRLHIGSGLAAGGYWQARPQRMVIGQPVVWGSRGSFDPDSTIAYVIWRFKDSTAATLPILNYEFMRPGTFGAATSARPRRGAVTFVSTTVSVVGRPPTTHSPVMPARSRAGGACLFPGTRRANSWLVSFRWRLLGGRVTSRSHFRRWFRRLGCQSVHLEVWDADELRGSGEMPVVVQAPRSAR